MRDRKYWTEKLGEGWANALKETLKSPYMDKLMNFLDCEYALNSNIYPKNQKLIFNAFKECPWEKVKVVIIGYEPIPLTGAGPLAFTEEVEHSHKNTTLTTITTTVFDQYYKGFNINFDFTLKEWANQGVLLLNQCLTGGVTEFQYRKQWKRFLLAVVQVLTEYRPGTIFFLWGEESQFLMPMLDMHHVFNWEHPSEFKFKPEQWNCPNFEQANKLIKYINGESEIIRW